MSFIKNFPTTTFTLPTGNSISMINIFKSFVISKTTKDNNEILNKVHGVFTNKIENLNYELYGDTVDLYWTLLYLNDIDSFPSCQIPQSKFESNLSTRYQGKVYYIKNAIDANRIIKGDMVILFTQHPAGADGVTAWRTAGIVKEYDSKFRLIILEKEYENDGATMGFSAPNFYNTRLEVRRKYEDSWICLGGSYEYNNTPENDINSGGFMVGRVENEVDKIIALYEDGLNGRDVSPYQIVTGSTEFTSNYDFAITGTTSGTVLHQLASIAEENLDTPVSNLYFYTLRKDEIRKNTNSNSIKYLSIGRASALNAFVFDMLKTNFRRGQEVTIT